MTVTLYYVYITGNGKADWFDNQKDATSYARKMAKRCRAQGGYQSRRPIHVFVRAATYEAATLTQLAMDIRQGRETSEVELLAIQGKLK